jgi:hypothetical protein
MIERILREQASAQVEACRTQTVLFISDPVQGDIFVIGNGAENYEIPKDAITQLGTAEEFLETLDFNCYEQQPAIYITAQDGTFIRMN